MQRAQSSASQSSSQGQSSDTTEKAELRQFIMDALKKQSEEIKESIKKQHDQIRDDIVYAVSGLSKMILQVGERLEEISDSNFQLEAQVQSVENRTTNAEHEITLMQYRDMEFAVRLRGIKENIQMGLKEACAEALAVILQGASEDVFVRIDKIYRVNSRLARERNLPRDVVIYFTERSLRNAIVQAAYKSRLKVDGEEIGVFKEIPAKILRDRKDFAFIVDELKKQGIIFRWDIPYGLIFSYGNTRYRIKTVEDAQEVYEKVLRRKSASPVSNLLSIKEKIPEKEMSVVQISQKEDTTQQIQTYAQVLVEGATGGAPMEEDLFSVEAKRYETRSALKQQQQPKKQQHPKQQRQKQSRQMQTQEKLQIVQTQTTLEAVGGARPKVKEMEQDLQQMLDKLQSSSYGS